jgi:cytochrome-b5 reductase
MQEAEDMFQRFDSFRKDVSQADTMFKNFDAFLNKGKATMPDSALERCSSCFFPTEFYEVPLIATRQYNHDTKVFSFGLPDGVSLDLPVCACILLKGANEAGEPTIRPYTPISSNEQKGSFDLLVKIYPQGVVSQWLNTRELGAKVGFKHIPFNIKAQYPFEGKKKLNMICGGTGITPMYQALLKIINTPGDDLQVTLLYGNKSVEDILLRKELEQAVARGGGRFKVVHVVGDRSDMPRIAGWDGELGWVDQGKVKKYCFPPAEDVLTFVCGVPALYDVMCGPRTEPEVRKDSVLAQLGYTQQMISKL